MGKHSAPEPDPLPSPVGRKAPYRNRHVTDRTVPGLLFPIVDDLSLIAADDELLDAIAAGRTDFGDLFAVPARFSSGYVDHRDRAREVGGSVAPLLATWRSAVVDPPLRMLPPLEVPRRAMYGPASGPPRRSLRPILGVATAICALLVSSTAVGAHSAIPGDALWPLAQVLYTGHVDSVKAGLAASLSIDSARKALEVGNTVKALVALTSAADEVGKVSPNDGKEKLQADLNVVLQQATKLEVTASASSRALTQPASVPVPGAITGTGGVATTNAAAETTPSGPGGGSTVPVTSRPVVASSAPLSSPEPTVPILPVTPVTPVTSAPPSSLPTGPSSVPSTTVKTSPASTLPASSPTLSSGPVSTVPASTVPSDPASTDTATMNPGSSVSGAPTSTVASTTSVMPTPTPTTATTTPTADTTYQSVLTPTTPVTTPAEP